MQARAACNDMPCSAAVMCHYACLQVISALNACNYTRFFKLYSSVPNLGRDLMDFMLHDLRLQRYERMMAAYSPCVPTSVVMVCIAESLA